MNNILIFTETETELKQLSKYRKRTTAAKAVVFLFAAILMAAAAKDLITGTSPCVTPVVITLTTGLLYLLVAITSLRHQAFSLTVAAATTALFIPSALIILFTVAPKESIKGTLIFLVITVVATIILANGAMAARRLSQTQPQL